MAYSPDGQTLASVSRDTTCKLWNVETGEVVRTLGGHTGGAPSVAFSAEVAITSKAIATTSSTEVKPALR